MSVDEILEELEDMFIEARDDPSLGELYMRVYELIEAIKRG